MAERPGFRLRAEVDEEEARVLVAVDDRGELLGMAAAGVTRDPDAPAAWELYSITTLARIHGSGVADDLLRAVVGDAAASLWVLRANGRARAFYRRHGFVADGVQRVHEGTGAPEVRMVRGAHGRG